VIRLGAEIRMSTLKCGRRKLKEMAYDLWCVRTYLRRILSELHESHVASPQDRLDQVALLVAWGRHSSLVSASSALVLFNLSVNSLAQDVVPTVISIPQLRPRRMSRGRTDDGDHKRGCARRRGWPLEISVDLH
jgi:hypothetical protein